MDSCGREGRQLVNLTVQVTQHISLLSTKKENTGPDLFWLRIALKDGQTGTANTEGRLATYSLKKKKKLLTGVRSVVVSRVDGSSKKYVAEM